MMTWAEFYSDRNNDEYLAYAKKRYAEHINAIDANIRPGDTVHEIGCGTGTITKALIERGRSYAKFEASDLNDDMLLMAKRRLRQHAMIKKHDILSSNVGASIIHSHGVLEHFSDENIRSIIEHNTSARIQIHYVPGEYPSPSFGDERLMPLSKWKEICNPSCAFTFNEGKDFCLVFHHV